MLGRFVALQLFYLGTNDQYVPFLDIFGPILATLWLFLTSFEIGGHFVRMLSTFGPVFRCFMAVLANF